MGQRLATRREYEERINAVLHHVHSDLSANLDVERLAAVSCYSGYHFQRIFRQVTGESVHDYIRRVRLEWAANLLIFNPDVSISEVAQQCGFASNASFTHAFKSMFALSPSGWRKGGYERKAMQVKSETRNKGDTGRAGYYDDPHISHNPYDSLSVNVKRIEPQRVAYLRHTGYDHRIGDVWHRLVEWAAKQGMAPSDYRMIGLHHSNPELVPFTQGRYVACITIPEGLYRRQGVSVMTIPGGLHGCASAQGEYGDMLYLMHTLYRNWLPHSGYAALNLPAHACYRENHFINQSGRFDVEFRIPVRVL